MRGGSIPRIRRETLTRENRLPELCGEDRGLGKWVGGPGKSGDRRRRLEGEVCNRRLAPLGRLYRSACFFE